MANSYSSCSSSFTFGRGKISSLMGDVAKGIKSFKKGMSSEEKENKSDSDKDLKFTKLIINNATNWMV